MTRLLMIQDIGQNEQSREGNPVTGLFCFQVLLRQ